MRCGHQVAELLWLSLRVLHAAGLAMQAHEDSRASPVASMLAVLVAEPGRVTGPCTQQSTEQP